MSDMTLIQKINETKNRLASAELKKSGKNTFQKYDYFELGDFLPVLIKAEADLNFANVITFTADAATLTILDGTSDKMVTFTSPIADAATKGASPIQAVGSMHTYMRRYLYVLAYEIAEHDAVDGADQTDKPEPKKTAKTEPQDPKPDKKAELIDTISRAIYPNGKQAGPDGWAYEIFVKLMTKYNGLDKRVKSLKDLNLNQLEDMMQQLMPDVLK